MEKSIPSKHSSPKSRISTEKYISSISKNSMPVMGYLPEGVICYFVVNLPLNVMPLLEPVFEFNPFYCILLGAFFILYGVISNQVC
jgi:hypothetical protein